jgi:hypothetical protein
MQLVLIFFRMVNTLYSTREINPGPMLCVLFAVSIAHAISRHTRALKFNGVLYLCS